MQQTVDRAPHTVQVPSLAKESCSHLIKRLACGIALAAVVLDMGSLMCPVMAVKNPYLSNAWAVEGLTLAAVTFYTLEELGEINSDTARQPRLTMDRRANRVSCTQPEQLARLSLDQVLTSAAQPTVKIFSDQEPIARPPRATASPVSLAVWGTPSTGYYCTLRLGAPQEKVMRSRVDACVRACVKGSDYENVMRSRLR